jgi:hypothetical protein
MVKQLTTKISKITEKRRYIHFRSTQILCSLCPLSLINNALLEPPGKTVFKRGKFGFSRRPRAKKHSERRSAPRPYKKLVQAEARAGRVGRFRVTLAGGCEAWPVVARGFFTPVLLRLSVLIWVWSRIKTRSLERSYPNSAAMAARASLTSWTMG